MQSKAKIILMVALFFAQMSFGQNQSLQEIKLDEFGSEAFVGLTGVMEDYQIFMWGEDYQKELGSNKFEINLIKFLVKSEGVRGLLFEEGIAKMHLVNQYINGGDQQYLEMLTEEIRERDYKLYQALRKMNDSLPAKDKVQIYGIRADENLEHQILYIYENRQHLNFDGLIDRLRINITADALFIYNKYNFTDILQKDFKFVSVGKTLNLTEKDILSLYWPDDGWVVYSDSLTNHSKYSFWNYYSGHYQNYSGELNEKIDVFNHTKAFLKLHPNTKFYAHFPWCNLERDQINRNCGVYAYGEFIKHKEELKVFSVMSLALNPNSDFTFDKKFNSQINTTINNGYRYAGFGNKDDLIDYVFLNRNTLLKNRSTGVLKEKQSDKYLSIYANYGLFGYVNNDVSGLNESIQNEFSNFSGFKTELGLKFADLTVDYSGWVWKISHKWTNEDPILLTNTKSVEFNQRSTTFYSGYNLMKNRKLLIAPMIGFGHAQSDLTYVETIPNSNPPFNTFLTKRYSNPGFIIDYMIDGNFVLIDYVGLGAKVGYVLDLSDRTWLLNGNPDSNTPSFSNSGFHAEFSVLLNFNKILSNQ